MKKLLISLAAVTLLAGASAGSALAADKTVQTKESKGNKTHTATTRTVTKRDANGDIVRGKRVVTVNREMVNGKNVVTGRNVTVKRTTADSNNNARANNARANRADLTQYRRNVRASRRYHAGSYRGPSGYQYRRYSYGERLPSIYFASNFWLSDFVTFGLASPPYGYRWVRYGDDALLIDDETGEIVQVQYDIFD